MAEREFSPLSAGVLTISDTRTQATDKSGQRVVDTLEEAGHRVAVRQIVRDDIVSIRKQFEAWQREHELDVVITTGGTGVTARDVTPEALEPLVTKQIPGFGELFRQLSYDDIGAATIQSRAFAALCDGVLLFALPGSTGAVRLALDKIIVPQLDLRTKPCNFAMLLPRLKGESGS